MKLDYPSGVKSQLIGMGDKKIHLLRCGESSKVVIFIHGLPVSSYMWRDVIAALGSDFSCYALDLSGCGLSPAFENSWDVSVQVDLFKRWIQTDFPNQHVTLVGHGYGSIIVHGLVTKLQDQVDCVVVYEGYLRPIKEMSELGLPIHQLQSQLDASTFEQLIVDDNFMIDEFLPIVAEGQLDAKTLEVYRSPYQEKNARKAVYHMMSNLMDLNENAQVATNILGALQVYKKETLKKVLLYSMPGMTSNLLQLDDFRSSYPNVVIDTVGEAFFLAPEFNAALFSDMLRKHC